MKKFLKKTQEGVLRREWAKDLLIRTVNYERLLIHSIAEHLKDEGKISDSDLIFFMTLSEVRKIIDTPSGKIISRALRRRRIYPTLMNLKYEEIFMGYPEALVNDGDQDGSDEDSSSEQIVLTGTPVGRGTHQGVARVVTSLEEANQIKNGEVLVVPYTDIGWSPYFPLIGGLVTEVGGLVSHGAVIAREYGLPCVVGCKKATHKIKTGDRITIDGKTGQVTAIH